MLLQWEIRAPMPSICFRTLCKQIRKFYEALCDVIEPAQLQVSYSIHIYIYMYAGYRYIQYTNIHMVYRYIYIHVYGITNMYNV